MLEQLLNQHSLYVWAKDKNYKYIYVNENYAAAAGVESPHQMIGKTDDQMPWSHLAVEFQKGDYEVYHGEGRLNSVEKSSTVNGVTDILVSETPFFNESGKVIGVKGSFIDITGKQVVNAPGYYDDKDQRYYLGVPELGDIHLTQREVQAFKYLLQGWSAREIGDAMGVSRKTAETYIMYIKRKFGVSSKADLLTIAMQYGLSHLLDVNVS